MAASTFKLGLPYKFELRDSLTIKPPENMHQLMRWIEEYNRLEDNRLQSKGKAPAAFQYQREHRIGVFQQRPRREDEGQNRISWAERVNVVFKELVHKILEKIKHDPYFRWSGKMGKDPTRRNQNLYYTYHQDKEHTTE